jgi:hypothetical protein
VDESGAKWFQELPPGVTNRFRSYRLLWYISAMKLLYIDYLLNRYRLETIGSFLVACNGQFKSRKMGKTQCQGHASNVPLKTEYVRDHIGWIKKHS